MEAQVIILALIVAVGAFAGPFAKDWLAGSQRARERQQDHDWQIEVANKVEAVKVKAAEVAESQGSQLKQIHTLVNSDKTAAFQTELNATRANAVLLRRVMALDKVAGTVASPEDLEVLTTAEARIVELQVILADRLAQQKLVEEEQARASASVAAAAIPAGAATATTTTTTTVVAPTVATNKPEGT